MNVRTWFTRSLGLASCLAGSAAWAHNPVFAPGPHVLYKGGVEIAPQTTRSEAGSRQETESLLNLAYGITGDWSAGVELPYVEKETATASARGQGDIQLFTKYRFWRHDTPGAQETAALLLKVNLDTAKENTTPALGGGATDTILGLAYGYESRKWYRWAAARYRSNGTNNAGFKRGDKLFVDLAGGIRFKPTGYLEPDTVWMLELNGEYGARSKLNGVEQVNTGGTEWFLSPGLMWTYRNYAIKAGAQALIASDLNGVQNKSDYRARLVFEVHL